MSRRKLKRIDYSKFGASGPSSDSEDDFQESPSPKKAKTDKKIVKKAEKKSERIKTTTILSDCKPEENVNINARKRATRTSNADVVYEQDLLTAIEVSKSSETSPKNELKKTDVISVSDSEDEENIIKLLKKSKSKSHTIEDSSEEEEEDDLDDNPAFAATIPIARESIKESSQPSPLKEITMNKITANKNTPTIVKKSPLNNRTPVSKDNITVKRTPTISHNNPSDNNKSSKIETPGRLRLGLSRNIRIAKPLHSNVKSS